jgi:hypothetical protein
MGSNEHSASSLFRSVDSVEHHLRGVDYSKDVVGNPSIGAWVRMPLKGGIDHITPPLFGEIWNSIAHWPHASRPRAIMACSAISMVSRGGPLSVSQERT